MCFEKVKRRRRICKSCGSAFTTYEMKEEDIQDFIKFKEEMRGK